MLGIIVSVMSCEIHNLFYLCRKYKRGKAFFNKNVVENVEVGNGDKESTYRSRKASVRAVFAGKCQVVDVGKFSTAKSEVVYGVLLPESAKWYVEDIWGVVFRG